jgi:hypothetical protein
MISFSSVLTVADQKSASNRAPALVADDDYDVHVPPGPGLALGTAHHRSGSKKQVCTDENEEQMSDVVLLPGLKVDVDGVFDDHGRIVAKTITVDGDDLETAEMIQSGLHPTAEQVAANMQAIAANKQNIETHGQNIAANQQNIAANRQNIETNQQNVAANKQQIEKNIKDVPRGFRSHVSNDVGHRHRVPRDATVVGEPRTAVAQFAEDA